MLVYIVDYVKFLSHCQREFSSENLLFISIMAQWQFILIDYNLWPKNANGELDTSIQLIDVNSTKVMEAMDIASMFHKLDNYDSNDNDHDDNSDGDYSRFVPIIRKIYKKYIEMNKAPFEINISFETREKIRGDYVSIKQNEESLNDETFWNLWNHLLAACHEVLEMVPASLMRCFQHDQMTVTD